MDLSIVIPIYLATQDLIDMTTNMVMESLRRNYHDSGIEVVLVDDASPISGAAETIAQNSRQQGLDVKLIKNEINQGYGAAVNKGVAAATKKYILILNNDTYLPAGSCEQLIAALEKYNLGMVGPVLGDAHKYKAQQLSAPHFITNYSNVPYAQIEQFSHEVAAANTGKVLDVNFLIGACMLTTKAIWQEASGISPQYGRGYYEEMDLDVRLRRLGYKLGVATDVFVLHESIGKGSPSFSSLRKLSRRLWLSRNAIVFLLRNGFAENNQFNYDWGQRKTWPYITTP